MATENNCGRNRMFPKSEYWYRVLKKNKDSSTGMLWLNNVLIIKEFFTDRKTDKLNKSSLWFTKAELDKK